MKYNDNNFLKKENQTKYWTDQSYRYVSSYLNFNERGVDRSFSPKHISDLSEQISILDVGCGNGCELFKLIEFYNASKGIGVEPSDEAIRLLRQKYSADNRISFVSASAHSLPFESDSFDLVTAWSVLHWVGRNEYLQALGELVRVTSRYLVVMDFATSCEYKVPYSHKEGFFTYKMDFEVPLISTGILRKVAEECWDLHDGQIRYLSESDLLPFEKNKINWDSRKMVIFEKRHDKIPCLNYEYFSCS